MIEIRGNSLSIFIDDKEVGHDVFTDKELNEENVYIVVDFEFTDGESVHYYGFDELPVNEPAYKPAVTQTTGS